MKNRFVLAPLTNQQSHPDGTLSEDEFHWLTLRAEGGFGLVNTCAAHVQREGQGFPGQLGIFSDDHLPGLTRLASTIKGFGALAVAQLHHAGMRSPKDLIGQQPVSPSDNEKYGSRALTEAEIEALIDAFVAAAVRAERAGFDGVEVHGAHGYVLCEFLSPGLNRRTDRWGGSLENRSRITREIVTRIRARCRPEFLLGLRLSPERFDLRIEEMIEVAQRFLSEGALDQLDMSLWDVFKEPEDPAFKGKSLIDWFTPLDRGATRLGVAGKIMAAETARRVLGSGADFAIIGRAGILHHDYPMRVRADPDFRPVDLPVTREYLRTQGLGPAFIDYMKNFEGFLAPAPQKRPER
jgi:2,4-dienoyl-CoA reductase-like NADH-dependent reductase (Old Yellow Enzyme family)